MSKRRIVGYFALPLLLLLFIPPRSASAQSVPEGGAPGPDVVVGDLPTLIQAGSNGTQVGLALGTDICNNGDVQVNWFRLPEIDHPVIPQNLYRLSGGANNDERFEQIGQSWVKHQFFPLQQDACGFGCTPSQDSAHLGVGCSTPDSAALNGSQPGLGSRAWVQPFTGAFTSTSNSHTDHTHDGTTHRILVEGTDLDTTMNTGATYYGEAQLVTPHEYAWCQSHPGECNMFNNVSYRQFVVTGTTSFSFAAVGSTVRTPAINAWPGATIQTIEPEPGVDGKAFLAYKVTQVGPFLWHYEYAIYNQDLDRGIQFFSVPAGCGIGMAGNLGFHAPLNHPGIADDGTAGDAGYSNAPWSMSAGSNATWATETLAQNPNANALRWGTLYNFRFEGGPPIMVNGTIGFFKTGAPTTVSVPGPVSECVPSPSPPPPPTPTATVAPTPTPSPTATPPATPSPSPTATATATPNECNSTVFREHFDGVIPPALPVSWVASFTAGAANCTPGGTCAAGSNWATSPTSAHTFPNSVFRNAPSCVTDSTLDSPSFYHYSRNQFLSFRHHYDLESGFDGAVLEISINGGPFIDFVAAGGEFQNGGYNGTITTGTLNPIAGRAAWTGNSGGYILTSGRMPVSVAGPQSVVLRFRLATDCSGAGPGWRVDTIDSVYYSVSCTSPTPFPSPPGTPTPSPTPTATPSPPPTTKALNLSTRMRVQVGDLVGIGGFIITGSAPKHVLIRAIGPSLTGFGVPDVLANPVLELHGSGTFATIINNNWRDFQEQAIQATGIAPTHNLESAIVAQLAPGTYTAIVRGSGNTSGVALVEFYDLNPGVDSKLGNISTRALVGTGNDIVIAGFILGNSSGSDRVVLRGIGPSLAQFGVPDALANPILELRDNNGALVRRNHDWQDDSAQAAELTAAGLAPANSLESGIAATLPPGAYTALLAGSNNSTGVGVVEIYDRGPPP